MISREGLLSKECMTALAGVSGYFCQRTICIGTYKKSWSKAENWLTRAREPCYHCPCNPAAWRHSEVSFQRRALREKGMRCILSPPAHPR